MRKEIVKFYSTSLIISVLLSLLLITGCTLGPEPVRPANPAEDAGSFVHAGLVERVESGNVSRWWEQFNDPALNDLVEMALGNNSELIKAAARVMEADANLRSSRGSYFPTLQYGASGSRQKSSFVLPTIGRTGIYSTTYSQDLSISYEIDLFGRLARSRQSAWADYLATEADREALTHAVIASVVKSRVQVASLQKQVALTEQDRESWALALEMLEQRYRSGLASPLEVHMARENLAANRARLVELQQSHTLARHALDVIVGRYPGASEKLPDTSADLPPLTPLPVGIPSSILDNRPDLKAAELRTAASTARVGIAMANLFPKLTLTASGGIRSDTLSNLTSTDGLIYSAVAGLVAPLFQGGKLRAEVDVSKARMEQAAAAYAGLVLNALREVEDALVKESFTREIISELEVRVREASASEELAAARYRKGVNSLLLLLETQRKRRSAETLLQIARTNLYNARTDLFLALGGDWNETEPENPNRTIKDGNHD